MRPVPLRVRVAGAFAVAMAVVLAATGLLVYARLGSHLSNAIDSELRVRAEDLSALVQQRGVGALSAVEETLQLKRGETILIQGGAGGVAGFAIQLAKHIGARVITTTIALETSKGDLPRRRLRPSPGPRPRTGPRARRAVARARDSCRPRRLCARRRRHPW